MCSIKKVEGKREFLMQVIEHRIKSGQYFNHLIRLLNISDEEINYIYQEFDKWQVEKQEKQFGAAEVIEQIKMNNPKYKLESQKQCLADVLGISLQDLLYLEKLLQDKATIRK